MTARATRRDPHDRGSRAPRARAHTPRSCAAVCTLLRFETQSRRRGDPPAAKFSSYSLDPPLRSQANHR
eukprot:6235768-Prymnesium_polylepis.1